MAQDESLGLERSSAAGQESGRCENNQKGRDHRQSTSELAYRAPPDVGKRLKVSQDRGEN